ncbi:expressed unknown protein [Seminavis robusta]|uniref:Uncharacterized protein n=1 Tax=Seminavis robusta TaxID=568900 RepID=A0A9N8DRG6_9STRA|nr:expressed unknown protein [Seminavis robusta]|eukprot:Sro228_g092721.1  (183) ;mRNA; f:56689-57237
MSVPMPHHIVLAGLYSPASKEGAKGDLICIAAHYLLRIGEYYTDRHPTQRFRVKDIIFRHPDQSIIPSTDPLQTLLKAEYATIRITNQKNGQRGPCAYHQCTRTIKCPVIALAQQVARITKQTANINTAISTYHIVLAGFISRPTHFDLSHAERAEQLYPTQARPHGKLAFFPAKSRAATAA